MHIDFRKIEFQSRLHDTSFPRKTSTRAWNKQKSTISKNQKFFPRFLISG